MANPKPPACNDLHSGLIMSGTMADESMYDRTSEVADLDVLHDVLQDHGSDEVEESYNYKRVSADNLFERLNKVALSAKSDDAVRLASNPDVTITAAAATTDDDVDDASDPIDMTLTAPVDETDTEEAVIDQSTPDDQDIASYSPVEEETENVDTAGDDLIYEPLAQVSMELPLTEAETWAPADDDLTDESIAQLSMELPATEEETKNVDQADDDLIDETLVQEPVADSISMDLNILLPPPAPVLSQPVVHGSMTAEDEYEESDSDDDVTGGENDHLLHPPLHLETVDDEDQLEVDAAMAEEIQRVSAVVQPQSEVEKENALLDVLKEVPTVSFDEEHSQSLELEEEVVHPESSVKIFGIGYQNMRKAQSNEYALPSGNDTFHEFEHEVTLTTDLSLQGNRDDVDDEFTSNGVGDESSIERVHALLDEQKDVLEMHAAQEAVLLEEMRLATEAERVEMTREESQVSTGTEKQKENAPLTLTELHTIYKKGFGDQEVLMLDQVNENGKETANISPPLTVMGRILSKKSIIAITEDDDEEDEEKDNGPSDESLHEDPLTSLKDQNEEVVDEWNEVLLTKEESPPNSSTTTNTKDSRRSPRASTNVPIVNTSSIHYEEALEYFMNSNEMLEDAIDRIVVEDFPAPHVLPCLACLSPRPRLTFVQAVEQRERLFCIAATSLNPRNLVHVQLLQTTYRALIQTIQDVPLMGAHWENIGFQGSDPATDLRGCGVLSLLQMVYLVEHHRALALRFYAASQHNVRHFPMACALINITLHCLMSLRSGALYPECNKQSGVFNGFNTLFIALTTELLRQVESSDDAFPSIMKKVLDHGRVHPDKLIQHVQTNPIRSQSMPNRQPPTLSSQDPRGSTRKSAGGNKMSNIEFTEIGLHEES